MRRLYGLVLAGCLLAFLAGCTSGDDDGSGSNDVTFSGTIDTSGDTAARSTSVSRQALSDDPTDYQLFCVTFTEPPRSGRADFDEEGNFTITIESAAGLPIGCFINEKESGTTVTSITFRVDDDSGLGDGTSSSATVEGGEFTININFNPTTGTATTDVRKIVTDDADEPTFNPADLVGEWIMTCSEDNSDDDLEECRGEDGDDAGAPEGEDDDDDSFDNLRVYFDVITATEDGKKLYAMAAWDGKEAYIAAGRTEGIPESELEGFTKISSLSEGGSVDAPFNGFTGQPEYNRADNTMTGDDIITVLNRLEIGYDRSFDNSEQGPGECDDEEPDLDTMDGRHCLMRYLEEELEDDELLFPEVSGAAWEEFVNNEEADGSTPVPFQATKLGSSPLVEGRFALMGLEFVGNTAVATDREEFNYMRFSESQEMEECAEIHEVTIVMSFTDDDTVKGRFTTAEFDTCEDEDEGPEVTTVLVHFNRPE